MTRRLILVAAACAVVSGGTHRQLIRSTALTTGTVMDIQYQTVLNNLALLSFLRIACLATIRTSTLRPLPCIARRMSRGS